MNGIFRRRLEFARALASAVLVAACFVSGAIPAQAAANVAASFSQAGGYGRIVLSWPGGLPAHKEALTTGVLVVSFDRPFTTDLNEFMRRMPDYVSMARQDGDGKTLRIALKFDFWLNVRQAENSLYVDLLPPNWTGQPPPLPAEVLARIAAKKEAKRKAEEEARRIKAAGIVEPGAPAPGLSVRVGRHEGITRLVFDWNQPVLYSLAQEEGSATITFDRSAKVSLAPIRVNPPPYLETITAREHEGRLSVFLKLAPGILVTDFREELGIVLDLKPAQAAADAPTPAPAPPIAAEPAKTEPKPAASEHAPQTILPAAAAPTSATPAEAAPAAAAPAGPETPAAKVEAAVPETPAPAPAAEPEAASTPAKAEAPSPAEIVPLEVIARENGQQTDIAFPWASETGAAVFMRADMLWIVFDQRAPLDLSRFATVAMKRLGKPVEIKVADGTAVAFPVLGRDLLVGATEADTTWHVSIGETLASTGRPIAVARAWREMGEGFVSFDLKGARKVLRVHDPIVRDALDVATGRAPVQSMQAPRGFIEFQALQTAQGLAFVRIADDLNVAVATDTVVVTRRNGLTLSADNDGAASSNSSHGGPAHMDFAAWRGQGSYTDGRVAHEKNIRMSDVQGLAGKRLAYARFLVANGLGPEALTQMELALAADAKIGADPSFHALRGVAEVMAYRYPQAIADLSISPLALDPYAAAWRGLARMALDQPDVARRDFDLAVPLIETAEPALAAKVIVTAASADLAMKNIAAARARMALLPADIADPEVEAERHFVDAQIVESLNRSAEATQAYDRAIATNVRPIVVRARLAKALMLNRTGKLSDAKLADELDRLRMIWRGDDTERRILSKLAELRLAQHNVVAALKAMDTATMNFPQSDDARAMGARMPDIFADYFIDGRADKLPAVQALAFYYDFQRLTPVGRKGDELIRHLAERLISVDLLAQAEQLLRHQIEQRLVGGVARAQVAARLATVYLLDDKPQQALRAIRATLQNSLPEDLDLQRRLIEARALASLKQYDLSLDLLSEILGPASNALRADVLWEAQRWNEAGAAAEVLLADAASRKALDADDRFQIMRGAIAYSLADDEDGLRRLRTAFADRMAKTADASGFAIVSDPIEKQGVAFRELASRIAAVNTLERFVRSLKKTDRISAIDGTSVASN